MIEFIHICIFLSVLYVFARCRFKMNKQDKEIKKLSEELRSSRMTIEIYKETYQLRKVCKVPEGTIDAVKYAMIHNHPDNGGSVEKFILYRRCYENLTGGKRLHG